MPKRKLITPKISKKKELILRAARLSVHNFLGYDRREDEDLGYGDIEKAIKAGEITAEDIIDAFRKELETNL